MANKKLKPMEAQEVRLTTDSKATVNGLESERLARQRPSSEPTSEQVDMWARLDIVVKGHQEEFRKYSETDDARRAWAALDQADRLDSDAIHVEARGCAANLEEIRAGRMAREDAALIRERVARGDSLLDFGGNAVTNASSAGDTLSGSMEPPVVNSAAVAVQVQPDPVHTIRNIESPQPLDTRTMARALHGIGVRRGMRRGFREDEDWQRLLGDPPKWARRAIVTPGSPGRATTWNPVLLAGAIMDQKIASEERMRKAFRERPELVAWIPAWGDRLAAIEIYGF